MIALCRRHRYTICQVCNVLCSVSFSGGRRFVADRAARLHARVWQRFGTNGPFGLLSHQELSRSRRIPPPSPTSPTTFLPSPSSSTCFCPLVHVHFLQRTTR